MNIQILKDTQEIGSKAADLVEEILREKPETHLCLPTGGSPLGLYEEMVRRQVDLSQAQITKLDEWVGVPMDDEATCERFLWKHLLGPLAYPRDRYLAFDAMAPNPLVECRRVERELEVRGRIGLCILGLGMNGHLGLIEPAESLAPHAHVALLTEESRHHSMLAHLPTRPTHGMTLGIADLLQSERILFLVSGSQKRDVLNQWSSSPVTTWFPASLLKLHADCTVLVDEAAAL